jgi:hypothetical protein
MMYDSIMTNDRIRFVNPDVEIEVRGSEMLFVAWCLTHDFYDSDIDPLHRTSYVEEHQKNEELSLIFLKKRIEEALKRRTDEEQTPYTMKTHG